MGCCKGNLKGTTIHTTNKNTESLSHTYTHTYPPTRDRKCHCRSRTIRVLLSVSRFFGFVCLPHKIALLQKSLGFGWNSMIRSWAMQSKMSGANGHFGQHIHTTGNRCAVSSKRKGTKNTTPVFIDNARLDPISTIRAAELRRKESCASSARASGSMHLHVPRKVAYPHSY